MQITLTLDLPTFEEEPTQLSAVLRKLATTLEGDHEADVIAMDGSLTVRNESGEKVGLLEFDFD